MPLNNLLFVDDDPSVLRAGQRTFQRKLAFQVDTADSRDSAMEKIRSTRYDLIILDGLGGACFQICSAIQDLPHGQVVIFSSDSDVKAEAEKLGIPFYDKPDDINKMIETYGK